MDDPTPTVPGSSNDTNHNPSPAPGYQPQPAQVPAQSPASVQPVSQSSMNSDLPGGSPVSSGNSSKTDVLGIVSIVLAFFFTLAGLIVGIVGIIQAKKENRKATLSVVGTVLNTIFLLGGIAIFVLFFVLAGNADDSTNNFRDSLDNLESSLEESKNSNAEFVLSSEYQLSDICEGAGWPSNVMASTGANKVYSVMSESTSYPGSFSTSSFVNLADENSYDGDNPTVLDRVVCMTTEGQEVVSEVSCKLEVDDVEVTGIMSRKNYQATVYDVATRSEIGSFEIAPTSECPFFVSVGEDYGFVAFPDGDDGESKIKAFDASN